MDLLPCLTLSFAAFACVSSSFHNLVDFCSPVQLFLPVSLNFILRMMNAYQCVPETHYVVPTISGLDKTETFFTQTDHVSASVFTLIGGHRISALSRRWTCPHSIANGQCHVTSNCQLSATMMEGAKQPSRLTDSLGILSA